MGPVSVFSTIRLVLPVAAMMLAATGCGGKSPLSPSGSSTFTPGPLSSVPVYVGEVQLSDGASGTVFLRPSGSFSASASPKVFDVIVGLIEASLHAQGSAASGRLVLPAEMIDLTGSYSGGTFSVSGGGYELTAAQSGGSLSGTGTTPQGTSLTVTPAPPLSAGAPAPSNASGTYKGTYSFLAPAKQRSTNRSTGRVVEDCNFSVVFSGTLTLQLKSAGSGTYAALLVDDWKESDGPPGKCDPRLVNTPDPYTEFNGGSVGSTGRAEAAVQPTSVQLAWAESGPLPNGGTASRSALLMGSVSGSTVLARFTRTRGFSSPRGVNLALWSTGGWQGSIDVTLVKQ